MNRAWHERHVLPRTATLDERIRWHRAHQEACGCRPIPASLEARMGAAAPRPKTGVAAKGKVATPAGGRPKRRT